MKMLAIYLNEKQLDVLKYIFQNTSIEVFNYAVKNYNIQRIYTLVENGVSVNFFSNDKLRASVFVAELFNLFQTESQGLRAKEIKTNMDKLERLIKFRTSCKRSYYNELRTFNEFRDEYNLLNVRFSEFRKLYKKYKS